MLWYRMKKHKKNRSHLITGLIRHASDSNAAKLAKSWPPRNITYKSGSTSSVKWTEFVLTKTRWRNNLDCESGISNLEEHDDKIQSVGRIGDYEDFAKHVSEGNISLFVRREWNGERIFSKNRSPSGLCFWQKCSTWSKFSNSVSADRFDLSSPLFLAFFLYPPLSDRVISP